jgi:hypothetical protein
MLPHVEVHVPAAAQLALLERFVADSFIGGSTAAQEEERGDDQRSLFYGHGNWVWMGDGTGTNTSNK